MAKDIRTREMIEANADPTVEYAFPLKTREEIIADLARHPAYYDHGFYLSWNIKVGSFDTTGRTGDETVDPAFDQRWEEFVQTDDEGLLFWGACEEALSQYVEGSYTTFPGDDAPAQFNGITEAPAENFDGVAKFATRGRSAGHLCLTEWKSGPADKVDMRFDSEMSFKEWLDELSDDELARLYVLVENVDKDTKDPGRIVARHFNFRRSEMEREWAAEAAPKPAGM